MTYFGNQKQRPLSTQDKMASDRLAWLGLKCVKTGSLITVFGNIAKTKEVFSFGLVLFSFVLVLLVEHVVYHAQQRISDDEMGEQFSKDSQSLHFSS